MRHLKKYLANPDLIRRKLHWSLLRRFRPESQATVETWNGRLTFDIADGLIGKHLFVRRAFEQDFVLRAVRFLARFDLRPPWRDVLIDVGANIGMIAIAALRHGFFREALAVEPSPANFRLLRRNVEQNDLADCVHTRQLALSSAPGRLLLAVGGENSGGHRIVAAATSPQPAASPGKESVALPALALETVQVEALTFDELLEREFAELIDRLGLVWVDIEGHESQFLAGAGLISRRCIPVVCEFFPRLHQHYGTSRDEYLAAVLAAFTHFAILDEPHPFPRPIGDLPALYDLQTDARDAINLILFHA